jgi:hypothetical protein
LNIRSQFYSTWPWSFIMPGLAGAVQNEQHRTPKRLRLRLAAGCHTWEEQTNTRSLFEKKRNTRCTLRKKNIWPITSVPYIHAFKILGCSFSSYRPSNSVLDIQAIKTPYGPVYLACKPKIFPLPPITSNLKTLACSIKYR